MRRFSTFTDGGFYAMGVKPGDYELAVDPSVLDVLQASATPLRFTIAPTTTGMGGDRLRAGAQAEAIGRPGASRPATSWITCSSAAKSKGLSTVGAPDSWRSAAVSGA